MDDAMTRIERRVLRTYLVLSALAILFVLMVGCSLARRTADPLQSKFKIQDSKILTAPGVTVSWEYPQFYTTWGTRFTVEHSQDLRTWSVLTNVTLPMYSRNAVWTMTNEGYSVSTPMGQRDFFRVGVRP